MKPTYKDARIALDLMFKASTPDRRRAGREWLRTIIDQMEPAPERPTNIPPPPEGFTYYGIGPLKVEANSSNKIDVALFILGAWDMTGGRGDGGHIYALRTGSEIAKLNGLL